MKFDTGNILFTEGISHQFEASKDFGIEILMAMIRYFNCDWGELCEEDQALNDYAIENDERILGLSLIHI